MERRSEEERGFTVLLEEVRHEYRLLSERVTGLEHKVDRGFLDVRHEIGTGFDDIRAGITMLVKKLQEHRHANGAQR